ncbi:RHS repeat domain-containing protein [Flavobacterium sp.]|uniref:RHS repeat domain-containing protein n=1 Tax=Flavobacterium sp. TaxID=239 RepID=UPI003752810B
MVRLLEKKLPGKQWQFIVYDKLNRTVAVGPTLSPFSNLTTSGWLITKYDAFSRIIYTGWQTSSTINSAGRKTLQDSQNALTTTLNETKLTSGTIDGIPTYYSNVVAPTSFKLLTVNYYDNYTFPNVPTIPTSVEGQTVLNTSQVKNLQTGSWSRTLTTSTAIVGEINSILYDTKSRIISSNTKNYLGGYTKVDKKLDFVGVPQYTITYHKRLNADVELKTTNNFTYSPQGRLLIHTHQIGAGSIQLLVKNDYNEIGQLITKRVGGNDVTGATSLQKIDYTYNIRGWLTSINDITNLTVGSDPQDLFAFKINFNNVQNESGYTGTPLYNGNIAETYWRSKSDNVIRKYGYLYDNLNRLTNSIYQKPGATVPVPNSYNETLSYDKNGNITSLQRNGNTDGVLPAIGIDNLAYTYDTNSNKLLRVTDTPSTAISGFKDGTNTNDDYLYDLNGNLTLDNNKGITSIIYNHFNFPTKIIFGTTGNIEYTYNSFGQKLSKKVTQGSTITTRDYLGGYQYKNAVLQFFPVSEGYVAKTGAVYSYVFQYKDHLGNVRSSYTKNSTTGNLDIIEESHFYPFGLKHSGYNNTILTSGNSDAQKYKFEEQERQDELNLNLDSFKYRNYDYAIGRFLGVDPLSEKYNWQSNYSFCSNQVVHSREIEGLEAEDDQNEMCDQPDYTNENHGPGFGGEMTDNMCDAFPMGGELDEVIISAGFKDYDVNDESYSNDNDNYINDIDDGYSEEDEKALEDMADNFQNIGTVLSLVGVGLSMTVVGAPIGAALMAVGAGLSWGGIGIEFIEDAFDGHDGFDWGNHAMNIGSELIPGAYDDFFGSADELMQGADNLYIELGAAGSDYWMDLLNDSHHP